MFYWNFRIVTTVIQKERLEFIECNSIYDYEYVEVGSFENIDMSAKANTIHTYHEILNEYTICSPFLVSDVIELGS